MTGPSGPVETSKPVRTHFSSAQVFRSFSVLFHDEVQDVGDVLGEDGVCRRLLGVGVRGVERDGHPAVLEHGYVRE